MATSTTTKSRRRTRPPSAPSIPRVEQEWQVERFIDSLACATQLRHMLTYPAWKEADLAALVQDKWGDAQGVKRDDLVKMLALYRQRMLKDKGRLSEFYQRVMMEQLKDVAFDLKDVMREQHVIYSVQKDRIMDMREEELANGFPMSEVGNEIKIASTLLSEMRDSALEMQKIKDKAPPPETTDDLGQVAQQYGPEVAEIASNPSRRARLMQMLSRVKQIRDMKEGAIDVQASDATQPTSPHSPSQPPSHPPAPPVP